MPEGSQVLEKEVIPDTVFHEAVTQAVLEDKVCEGKTRKLYCELLKKSRKKRREEKRMKVSHREQARRKIELIQHKEGDETNTMSIRKSMRIIKKRPTTHTIPSKKRIKVDKVLKDSKKNIVKEAKSENVIKDFREEKPYVCSICNLRYKRFNKAKEHMSIGHGNSKGSYKEFKASVPRGTMKCDECDFCSGGVPHLFRHKVSKHGLGVKENGYIKIQKFKKQKSDGKKKNMIRNIRKREEGLLVDQEKNEDIENVVIEDVYTFLNQVEKYEVICCFDLDEQLMEKHSQGGNRPHQDCLYNQELREPTDDEWSLLMDLEALDNIEDILAPSPGMDFYFSPGLSTTDPGPVYTILVFAGIFLKMIEGWHF